MAPSASNIVQVEFFHTGGEHITCSTELLQEILERLQSGARIKTVVRFFDTDDVLTRVVRKNEKLDKRRERAFDAFLKTSGVRQWFLNIQSNKLGARTLALMKEKQRLAIKQLSRALEASQPVAVECSDYSFRLVRDNEKHDLREAANRSTGVWVFILPPGDLL